jgi:hypothetical protein
MEKTPRPAPPRRPSLLDEIGTEPGSDWLAALLGFALIILAALAA